MPASYMPTEDPREVSQSSDSIPSIESVSPPSTPDPTLAFSDTDPKLKVVRAHNGTHSQEAHNAEAKAYRQTPAIAPDVQTHPEALPKTYVASVRSNDIQPRPAFVHETSVLTEIPDNSGGAPDEDSANGSGIRPLEEDTLKLSVPEKMRHLSHHKQTYTLDEKDEEAHAELPLELEIDHTELPPELEDDDEVTQTELPLDDDDEATFTELSTELEPEIEVTLTEHPPELEPEVEDASPEPPALLQPATCDLVVVIPTHNEAATIVPLLQTLQASLDGIGAEIIFVDDSEDTTPLIIKETSVGMQKAAFRMHVEHYEAGTAHARRLATTIEHGLNIIQAPYVAVLDIHLSDAPALLRTLYDTMVAQDADLILATRYARESANTRPADVAQLLHRRTAKILFPGHLQRVSDPLNNTFLVKRSILQDIELRPVGQKLLLEILIRSPWQRLIEIPYNTSLQITAKSATQEQSIITTLQHMWRLATEVPAAARLWKLGGLVGINVIIISAILISSTYIASPGLWETLRTVAFSIIALLNFMLINRYIFPVARPTQQEQALATTTTQEQSLPQQNQTSSWRNFFAWLPLLVVIAATCWIIYLLPGVWVILAALLIGLSVLTHNNVNRHQTITMTLGVVVGLSAIDYVTWRFEVANWVGWWIAVPLLAAEVLGALHTIGFQYTLWPRSPLPTHETEDATRCPVFVFIPTVNEGVAVLEPTLQGALEARDQYLAQYPHGHVTIVVCNDGRVAKVPNWEETEELCKRMRVTCITRTVRGGAKAGNIENARQQIGATGDALIVIFDADQIAKPDFFLKTIPPFGDTAVGWVQTGQYYRNLDNPVARWADDQQAMFYNLLCPGKAARNASFICGTNVVIRAKALDQIGGLPQDSVTEDFAASITLHPYWRSLYLTDVLATGLGPMDLPSYLKQQSRWAMGTLGILRTHWRHIFLPKKHGLSVEQRIQYFLACTHYLCGVRDLIYLLGPILFIILGTPAVKGSTLDAFIWHFLPYFLSSSAALWYAGRGITGLRGIIIGFGSFPVLLQSLLSVILQRKIGFAVTSKQRGEGRSWSHLRVYIVFMIVCVICIILALLVKGRQQTPLLISVMWIVYSLFILGAFLGLGIRDIRSQASVQSEKTEAEIGLEYPARLLVREQGLRPVWNLAFALCLASLLFSGISVPTPAAQPAQFGLNQQSTRQPYLGVSLPIELLQSRPPALEQKLDAHFAIIGRTQDVNDNFDRAWADQLAQQHERPWVTIEFGTFEATGKPPLDANLPAIINGVDDASLQRWAEAARDYAKPMYLTILLHVDRNWALTSAVANGGIPQDVAPAWAHIRSIFKQAGAVNVAWVWAPADLIHDQQYAPPASMIDAVVAFLIRYPNTPWPNPKTVLTSAVTRYPTKPIIVEVSADGPAAQKSAWLTQLGDAAISTPNIHALIYKEGSPDLHATLAEDNLWSLASDESCLLAMHQVASRLAQAIR